MEYVRQHLRLAMSIAAASIIVIASILTFSLVAAGRSKVPATIAKFTQSSATNTPVAIDGSPTTAATITTEPDVPTATPVLSSAGAKSPTPKPSSPIPPQATATPNPTATPTSTYPQLGVTTPDGDSAICGTATQPGSYPRVLVTNVGGGTLEWFFSFVGEPMSLDLTYKLSATVNGQPALPSNRYYLTAGQSATFQLYQTTKAQASMTNEAFTPLSAIPKDRMEIDFFNVNSTYLGIAEQYPCTNYPNP